MTSPSREAVALLTPKMIAAAWDVVRDRYPRGPVLGPGPGFVEALAVGLAPILEREAAAKAEIEGLRARVETLEAALKPFCFDRSLEPILHRNSPDSTSSPFLVTIGDVRRARAALTSEHDHAR